MMWTRYLVFPGSLTNRSVAFQYALLVSILSRGFCKTLAGDVENWSTDMLLLRHRGWPSCACMYINFHIQHRYCILHWYALHGSFDWVSCCRCDRTRNHNLLLLLSGAHLWSRRAVDDRGEASRTTEETIITILSSLCDAFVELDGDLRIESTSKSWLPCYLCRAHMESKESLFLNWFIMKETKIDCGASSTNQ